MNIIDFLKVHVVREQKLTPLEELTFPEIAVLKTSRLDFMAAGSKWGSMLSIGLVLADSLSEREISTLCETFSLCVSGLRKHAKRMPPIPLIGAKMGSFGILCFIYQEPPSGGEIAFIQKQKRASMGSICYSLSWVLDVQNASVHAHEGIPLKMQPGPDFFKGLLYEYGVMRTSDGK